MHEREGEKPKPDNNNNDSLVSKSYLFAALLAQIPLEDGAAELEAMKRFIGPGSGGTQQRPEQRVTV